MPRKPALQLVASGPGGGVDSVSRTALAYELLRKDLLHGEFAPLEKLPVIALADKYRLGPSAVREALSRLSSEGLVDRIDQRGFRAAGLDWAELPVLTRTRCEVEALALRESIEHRTADWEDGLIVLSRRLARTPRSLAEDRYVQNPEWEKLHAQFHRALVANCPSRWLRQFCATLTDEAYRFRQVAATHHYADRDVNREHASLTKACVEGQVDKAVRLLRAHYRRTAALTRPATPPDA